MNPSPTEFKSNQYEFSDEQNKAFSGLADAMGTVSTLMKLLGLSFVVFFGMLIYHAIQTKSGYGPAAGIGAAMLLFLAIGFWTGSAAHSFRRIVETKNEDIWHLMNAVESLKNMYGMLRSIIMLSLVLVIVGVTLLAVTWAQNPG
ncbi:MAG TPA: hypothetical protein VKE74_20505 [Gemmataceae bacterium]|nr:hypothetical protein [Gemmataceae bacterium]